MKDFQFEYEIGEVIGSGAVFGLNLHLIGSDIGDGEWTVIFERKGVSTCGERDEVGQDRRGDGCPGGESGLSSESTAHRCGAGDYA